MRNDGNIHIEFVDGAVQVSKIKDNCSECMEVDDEIDDLIWDALDNRN